MSRRKSRRIRLRKPEESRRGIISMKQETSKDPVTHRVQLLKDEGEFTELWLDVFIEGDRNEQVMFARWLVKSGCHLAKSPDDADIVIFTGGADVNPALYGETRHPRTFIHSARDSREIELYNYCLERGIPMFGVCRGAQFLHVMNGGKLFQDVDGHNQPHSIWDLQSKEFIQNVSSVHHQMCAPNPRGGMEIIATANVSKEKWINDKEMSKVKGLDIEAYFYRDTCCFGVQGHPEYAKHTEFSKWTLKKMEELLSYNPDIGIQGRVRRLKPEIVAERKAIRDGLLLIKEEDVKLLPAPDEEVTENV